MFTITKEWLKELKQARSLGIYRDSAGTGQITLFFEDEIRGKTVHTDKSWLCEVRMRSYQAKDYDTGRVYFESDKQDVPCHVSLSLYWWQGHHACSVLSTLRADDQIAFEFVGNCGNQYASAAGLHMDTIQILITRNGKRHEFELDTQVNPGNTARMIGGYVGRNLIDKTDIRFVNREIAEVS